MAVDVKRMKKDRAEADRKGGSSDLGTIEVGETLFYVCPPMYEDDRVPYLEYGQHFDLGKNKGSVANLEGLEGNKHVDLALKKRELTFDEVQEAADMVFTWVERSGTQRNSLRQQWLFNLVPVAYRRNNRKDWQDLDFVPQIFRCSKTVYNGITDLFFDEGDISDPDAARLVKVVRVGTGIKTEYEVKADSETLKNPMKLDDADWDIIDVHLQTGNKGDLYKKLATFCKGLEKAKDVLEGKSDDGDDDKGSSGSRSRKVEVSSASSRRRKRSEPDDKEEPKAETKSRRRSSSKDEEPKGDEEKPKSRRRRAKKDDEDAQSTKAETDGDVDTRPSDDEPEPPKRRRRSSNESDNGEARASPKSGADDEPEPDDSENKGDDADVDALEQALKSRSRRRRSAE